ncbi:MAG: type II secretion system F family protein [Sneathiella sp.]
MNTSFFGLGIKEILAGIIVICITIAFYLFRKAVRQREDEARLWRLRQISTTPPETDREDDYIQDMNWMGRLVKRIVPKRATDRLVGEMPMQNTSALDLSHSDYKMVLSLWGMDHNRVKLFVVLGKIIGMLISGLCFLFINELTAITETGSFEWTTLFFTSLIGGTFLSRVLAQSIVAKKRNEIEAVAPDVVDLLMLSVESGMTFDNALIEAKAALALYSESIAKELDRFSADLVILPSRSDAFANLVNRTGSNTLRYLSVALSQGEKYGTPIAASLRIVATESRKHALIRMEKKAAKLPVFLSVPLMIFILPPVVVVSAGPGFVTLMRSFGGSG